MNFWCRWDRKDPAQTHTSLILKRQIPIRFDEEPRSWLGGSPMMPKGMNWPRDAAGDPLHFIAQIACADIPPGLWNGSGPRKGWLLLFMQFHKFDDESSGGEATDGAVQVLHTTTLGVEHAPPDDLATVRHAMSDGIGRSTPQVRPGVPKLWRKWPVDLIVHQFRASDEELEENGTPIMTAQELYLAPVSDHEITVHGGIPLDRPLTWRGALYVVEGVLRDLAPEDLEREFVGAGGLLDAPEADQTEFNEEFDRLAATRQEFQDREVGWGPRVEAARAALNAELAGERKAGWIKRAFVALEREKLRHEGWLVEYQKSGQIDRANYQIDLLTKLEQHRAWLVQLQDAYPGPEGEARLNAEGAVWPLC